MKQRKIHKIEHKTGIDIETGSFLGDMTFCGDEIFKGGLLVFVSVFIFPEILRVGEVGGILSLFLLRGEDDGEDKRLLFRSRSPSILELILIFRLIFTTNFTHLFTYFY